jgi:hypothetical protein
MKKIIPIQLQKSEQSDLAKYSSRLNWDLIDAHSIVLYSIVLERPSRRRHRANDDTVDAVFVLHFYLTWVLARRSSAYYRDAGGATEGTGRFD